MTKNLKEVRVEASRQASDHALDLYVFDRAQRIGRYQVRVNSDGKHDIYYSDIRGGKFSKTRKVQQPSVTGNPIAAAVSSDLANRGLYAPQLMHLDFSL